MAVKSYPYTTPANYTYDTDKIEVSGGIAKLKEDLIDVYARYHLNSIDTGDSVEDTSGNSRDGVAMNSPSVVAGKLNNCFQFNGVDEYVNCVEPSHFNITEKITLEVWVYPTIKQDEEIITKTDAWSLRINKSGANIYLEGSIVIDSIERIVTSTTAMSINTWYHAVLTYGGGAVILYQDANLVDQSISIPFGTIASNFNDVKIGGTTNYFEGKIDEILIYDEGFTQTEVTFKYNSGNGRENWYYFTDKPTIEPTDLFDPINIISWDSFLETLGGGNEGSIGYNLYKVDKVNKYYWNGGAWVTGGSISNYNSQAVINTNIGTFDGSPDKIGFIAYLISDGEQKVELDENQITYSINQVPLVNAGSNKSCKDNETISPFSDCSFSDPDGTVDHVYHKVDGEVDTWTEIPQGGYGTLLEAVQAFNYQFNNVGTKTVRLQVEDDVGAKSEDSLEVVVSKYTKTVNIKDSVTGEHLSTVSFNPGDGTGSSYKDSPFSYSWEYGSFDIIMEKQGYYTKSQTISISDESDLNLTLVEESVLDQSRVSIGLITETDTLAMCIWLEKNGQMVDNPTSCEIWLYDSNEVLKYHPAINTSPNAFGAFHFSQSPSGLDDTEVYCLKAKTIANGNEYNSIIPVGQVNRDKSALNYRVYIDVINGESGTDFPRGTVTRPVNNLADAKTIANNNKLKIIHVHNDLTLDSNCDGYIFESESPDVCTITLNNQSVAYTIFRSLTLTGQCNGYIYTKDCHIDGVTNLEGAFDNNWLLSSISIKSGGKARFNRGQTTAYGITPIEVDMNGDGYFELIDYSCVVTIKNMTSSDSVVAIVGAGRVTLDSTIIDGKIGLFGNIDIVDNKTGGTLDNEVSWNKVWDELISDHLGVGSTGKALNDVSAGASPELIADAVWDELVSEHSPAGSFAGLIKRIAGLCQENYRIFNPVYDTRSNLLSGVIKIYPSASDVDTDTNAIASYSITATYNAKNQMNSYKVKKT